MGITHVLADLTLHLPPMCFYFSEIKDLAEATENCLLKDITLG